MAVIETTALDDDVDVTTTRTLLHEAIPLTGTIVSGTYGTHPNEENIKNYNHGMFQSIYDYPYLSSSANHIFDISACYSARSVLSSAASTQNAKKINMYTEFAQTLMGFASGSPENPAADVRCFESDLVLDNVSRMNEVFIINFSRLLTKDQIKKGSFSITLGTGAYGSPFTPGETASHGVVLSDNQSTADGKGTTSVLGGDMGLLFADSADGVGHPVTRASGAIFYQAGIAVISSSVFMQSNGTVTGSRNFHYSPEVGRWQTAVQALTGASISGACDSFRHRIQNISFNNTTEINSKIYFCRVPHNTYNYSSNPTYLSASKIRVKNAATDAPVSYITTIGLYNESMDLLATAKLSEPLRKDPTNDITIRVRLDY